MADDRIAVTGSGNRLARPSISEAIGIRSGKLAQPVTINGIEFDALISDDRDLTATIPEYSVEDGYSVSDGIIIAQETLSMNLIVTASPVTWRDRHSGSNHLQDTIKNLEELFYRRELCTIVTPTRTYTNMAIESMTFSETLEAGNSREIPISFKQVAVTQIQKTTYPATYGKSGKSGAAAGSAGTKSGGGGDSKSGDGDQKKGSILYNGYQWLKGKVGG